MCAKMQQFVSLSSIYSTRESQGGKNEKVFSLASSLISWYIFKIRFLNKTVLVSLDKIGEVKR